MSRLMGKRSTIDPEYGARKILDTAYSAKIAEIAAGPDDLTRKSKATIAISSPISEMRRAIAITRISRGRKIVLGMNQVDLVDH